MKAITKGQKGYVGQSMSVRAEAAYREGEQPISYWNKNNILAVIEDEFEFVESNYTLAEVKAMPAWLLKKIFLKKSSWHHTGALCNRTNFYVVDLEGLTTRKEIIQILIDQHKAELEATKESRKARAKANAERRAEKERNNYLLRFMSYTSYKTERGYLNAVKAGKINIAELEQRKAEDEERAQKASEASKANVEFVKIYNCLYHSEWNKLQELGYATPADAIKYLKANNKMPAKLQAKIEKGEIRL